MTIITFPAIADLFSRIHACTQSFFNLTGLCWAENSTELMINCSWNVVTKTRASLTRRARKRELNIFEANDSGSLEPSTTQRPCLFILCPSMAYKHSSHSFSLPASWSFSFFLLASPSTTRHSKMTRKSTHSGIKIADSVRRLWEAGVWFMMPKARSSWYF